MLLRVEKVRVAGSFPEQQLLQELCAAGLQRLRMYHVFKEPDNMGPSYFDQLASLSSSIKEGLEQAMQYALEQQQYIPAGGCDSSHLPTVT